jgi:inhibitor of cysteine peptidase
MFAYKLVTAVLVFGMNISAFAAVKPYSEDNRNIVVNASQEKFTILLKSNPTTGYSWFLREYDANLIAPKNKVYVPGNKKLIGSSGHESWTFTVKRAGFVVPQQTTIRMVYARPWEDVSKAAPLVFHISTINQ